MNGFAVWNTPFRLLRAFESPYLQPVLRVMFIIAVCAAAVYVLFVVLPSIMSFFIIFSRKNPLPLHLCRGIGKTQYAPYIGEISRDASLLEKRPHEEITVTSFDGKKLFGRLYTGTGKVIVLCFHGYNSTSFNNFAVQAETFLNEGFSVLLVDERAHGKSEGAFSGMGTLEKEDVLSWAEYIKRRFPDGKTVLYGISMGAAAVMLASADAERRGVSACIFDCGFASPIAQLARNAAKNGLPAALMAPYTRICAKIFLRRDLTVKAADALKNNSIPSLFLHGTSDLTVPIEEGRDLYASCASEKRFIEAPGAGHTLSFCASHAVRKAVTDFIYQYTDSISD